jgi:hypothetical protein
MFRKTAIVLIDEKSIWIKKENLLWVKVPKIYCFCHLLTDFIASFYCCDLGVLSRRHQMNIRLYLLRSTFIETRESRSYLFVGVATLKCRWWNFTFLIKNCAHFFVIRPHKIFSSRPVLSCCWMQKLFALKTKTKNIEAQQINLHNATKWDLFF